MNNYKIVKNTEWKEVEINGEVKEIPSDWNIDKFIKKEEFISGVTIDKKELRNDFNRGDTYFLRANNIEESGNVNFNNLYYISTIIKPEQYLKEKDILICLASGSKNLVGKTSLMKNLPNKSTIGSFCGVIRTENLFKYYLTRSYDYKNWLNQFEATSIFNLKRDNLLDYHCFFPPLSQQSSIASILSAQESIISDIESLISKYESRFQWLSEELLSGRLRAKEVFGQLTLYKNLEDNWKEVEVNGEMKEIPQDWEVDKLKNHILVINGYAFPKSKMLNEKIHNSLPIIKIGNIQDNIIIENSGTGQNYYSGLIKEIFIPQYNDLIIGLSGANAGKTGIYKILNQTALNQRNAIVRIKSDQISQDFFNYFWFKDALNVLKETTKDSAIPNISSDDIEIIDFFILNKTEQSNIAKLLSQQEDLINQQKQLLTKEKQKFDWLLDNLLSGKYLIKENNMDFKISNTIEEQNEWFKECQKKQIYYIYITERDKYAKINWDHISLNLSIEQELDEIHQPEREKLDGLIDLFMRHMNPRDKDNHKLPATYNGSTLVGYFDNIPKEKAHELAQDLANYLNGIVKNYINQPIK